MSVISSPKLLPCAHCGGTDVHLVRNDYVEEVCGNIVPRHSWSVECFDCGVSTQDYDEEYDPVDMDDYTFAHVAMDDAIDCAVTAWNTRANHVGFGG